MSTAPSKVPFTNNEIYEVLKTDIITLKLKPGTYIGETEISRKFNVSRTPIREVFKRLEYNNLIKAIPNKGTVITPINLEQISEFMFVREKLELGIIDELMPQITDEFIAQLKLILIKQRKVIQDTTLDVQTRSKTFYELDNQFHRALFLFDNKLSIWTSVVSSMSDYQRFRTVSTEIFIEDELKIFFNDHCAILEAMQKQDMDTIKKIYKGHIYNGLTKFYKLLNERESYFVI